jgi:putative endonuclease
VGSHRGEFVDDRIAQHQAGVDPKAWTYSRRPVTLIWADNFQLVTNAIAFERKLKGWSREKKLAFVRGDWSRLRELVERRGPFRGVQFPSGIAPRT